MAKKVKSRKAVCCDKRTLCYLQRAPRVAAVSFIKSVLLCLELSSTYTTPKFLLPPSMVTTMAAMGGVYVPECTSCHKPGNMACMGCLLVTVSQHCFLFQRQLTDTPTVLQQSLSNQTLGHSQAGLQLPAQTTALEAAMGARTPPACFRQRDRASTGAIRKSEVPLG